MAWVFQNKAIIFLIVVLWTSLVTAPTPLFDAERLVSNVGGRLSKRDYQIVGLDCLGVWICGMNSSGDAALLTQEPLFCGSPTPFPSVTEEPASILNSSYYFAVPGKDCVVSMVHLTNVSSSLSLIGEATKNQDGSACSSFRGLYFNDADNLQVDSAEFPAKLDRASTVHFEWASASDGVVFAGRDTSGDTPILSECQPDIFPYPSFAKKRQAAPPSLVYRMYFAPIPYTNSLGPMTATFDGRTRTFSTYYEPIFNTTSALQGIADAKFIQYDFDSDGRIDIFMCGTVYNNVTSQHQPYTAIWKNVGLQGFGNPPMFETLFTFTAVTHCGAVIRDFNLDGNMDIFYSGTDGAVRKCGFWLGDNTGNFVESTAMLGDIQCISFGDVNAGDFNGDVFPDLVVLGDDSSIGGLSILNASPTGASTRVYLNNARSSTLPSTARTFAFDSQLRALRKGTVLCDFFYTNTGPLYFDVVISGENNIERGTWAYKSSLYATTTASVTASTFASISSLATTAALSAAAVQATSLSSLSVAGLLDSTTAAQASLLSSAIASGHEATSVASVLTSTGTTSTATSSTFAVSSSTFSSSTTSSTTRTTAVTSAATSFAASVSDVATSLTSAAAAASAATAGAAFAPISNEQQSIILPPVSVSVDSEQGSLAVTPLFDEAGQDLPRVQYQVRAVKFTEYDLQTLEVSSCDAPVGSFFTTTSRGKAPSGGDTIITVFTALLCNDARLEVRYIQYTTADLVTFAGIPFGVQPQSVKVAYTVSNWPFVQQSNSLEVQFEMVVNQSSTEAISVALIPKSTSILLWNIKLNAQAYISSLIMRSGLVDSIITPLDIYPADSSFFRISIRAPYFSRSLVLDPNFDVLLDDRSSSKKKSPKGAKIAAGVSVGVGLLVVAGVILGYVLYKKKKKSASFGTSGSRSSSSA